MSEQGADGPSRPTGPATQERAEDLVQRPAPRRMAGPLLTRGVVIEAGGGPALC
jgi:hypothetical protein